MLIYLHGQFTVLPWLVCVIRDFKQYSLCVLALCHASSLALIVYVKAGMKVGLGSSKVVICVTNGLIKMRVMEKRRS